MITLIVFLVIVGFALWLIGLIPMDARILMAIRGLVLLVVVLYILQFFGVVRAGDMPRWR